MKRLQNILDTYRPSGVYHKFLHYYNHLPDELALFKMVYYTQHNIYIFGTGEMDDIISNFYERISYGEDTFDWKTWNEIFNRDMEEVCMQNKDLLDFYLFKLKEDFEKQTTKDIKKAKNWLEEIYEQIEEVH